MRPDRKHANAGVQYSPTVADSYPFLHALARTKSTRRRKRILKKADANQLLALVEICLNILRDRFHLTQRQKKRMIPYVDYIRKVGRVRSERGARKLVVQKGGQLPIGLFASILTPVIIDLAHHFLSKHNGQ